MNPANSRKQLLIAASELNRAGLVHEWQTMANNVCALASRAGTISSLALAAASLVAGLACFQRKETLAGLGEKSSWWRPILKSAGLFSAFWLAVHPSGCGQKEK